MINRGNSGIGKAGEPVSNTILSYLPVSCLRPLIRTTILDGKKVRKYVQTAESQTAQYDTNQYVAGYQSSPCNATTGLEEGMQGLNLQQQSAETYNIGASNYTIWPNETQSQGRPPYLLVICIIHVVNKL